MSSDYKIIKSGRLLDLAYQLGAMTIIGLFSFNAHATCTPTPDCTDMGYTETSCNGSFVRCPFDTSKLFCTPCDSSYQYDCTGDHIVRGIGNTCNEKFASCECDTNLGYYFNKGTCSCSDINATNCEVGDIYYADGRCSKEYVNCRNAVGVVVKDNSIVMALLRTWLYWSYDYSDVSNLSNINTDTVARTNYTGKANTEIIVNTYGTNADINTNASVFCYNYAPSGMESTKNKWYLPATGELFDYVYKNHSTISSTLINKLGWGSFSETYWTSNEYDTHYAWQINISTGSTFTKYKYEYSNPTTCFLTIN